MKYNYLFLINLLLNDSYNFLLVTFTSISSSLSKTHFSLSKIDIGLVDSNLDNIIFIITIIGTDKSIQTTHQIDHHNHNDNSITSGLKFNLLHINLGSIIFQTKTCIHINIEIATKTIGTNWNCIITNIEIIVTPIIEPTVGTKFNKKITNPQNKAKSTLNKVNVK